MERKGAYLLLGMTEEKIWMCGRVQRGPDPKPCEEIGEGDQAQQPGGEGHKQRGRQ